MRPIAALQAGFAGAIAGPDEVCYGRKAGAGSRQRFRLPGPPFDYTEGGVTAIMAHPRNPANPIPSELAELLAPRILARVNKNRSGCWIRYVNVNPVTGYTHIARKAGGRTRYYLAHRIMFVSEHGPIPEGLEIDHICEVRACCNPTHLRAVTHRENVLRGKNNYYAINARKVTCNQGHKFPDGERTCHTCRRDRQSARRMARKAQGVPLDRPEVHGTQYGYREWSCRCDECREWQRLDYRSRKAERGAA